MKEFSLDDIDGGYRSTVKENVDTILAQVISY